MNPAPSVILFTTLSGLGLGLLAFLGFGLPEVRGWPAFFLWALGYGLAVSGLLASTFHLANPQRALLAFSQWRSSWLSREAWAACLTLLLLSPQALSDWLDLGWGRFFGTAGALAAVVTIICTAMIYAQLKTVPRWNTPLTPLYFIAFSVGGGAFFGAPPALAALISAALGLLLMLQWRIGDRAFSARGHSLARATGLSGGQVSVFEQPHTGENYLMKEMIFTVGRRHAQKLRVVAVILTAFLPAAIMVILPPVVAVALAVPLHLAGALVARWLFFAEAEHVVGLYYGMR